jgi:hypothetical protein
MLPWLLAYGNPADTPLLRTPQSGRVQPAQPGVPVKICIFLKNLHISMKSLDWIEVMLGNTLVYIRNLLWL